MVNKKGGKQYEKILVVLSVLFVGFMMFLDYQKSKINTVIPEFTDEQIQFICNEEGLL